MATNGVGAAVAAALKFVRGIVETNPVALFGKTYCPNTRKVRVLFNEMGARFKETDLDVVENGDIMQLVLTKATGQPTVPYVFVGGDFIGGADDTLALAASGELEPKLKEAKALPDDNRSE